MRKRQHQTSWELLSRRILGARLTKGDSFEQPHGHSNIEGYY